MAKIANGFVTSLLLLKIFIISNVALADVVSKKYDGPYPVNETWIESSSGPYLQINGVTVQPMANESSDVLVTLGAAPQTWSLLKEYTPWIDVNRFGIYLDLGVGHNQTLIFRGPNSEGFSATTNVAAGTTTGLWLLNDCNGDTIYNGQDSYLFSQRSLTRGSYSCEHQWFMVYDVRAYRGSYADYNFITPTEDYRMNGDYDYLVYIDDDHTTANFDHNDMILGVKCNSAPVVSCPGDTAFSVCNLNQICIPGFNYADPEGNIVSVTVSLGTLTGNTVCFAPTGSGNYPITLIATDSGGLADTCTANINVSVNRPPVVSCPGQGNLTTCDLYMTVCDYGEICLPGFTYSDPDNNITSVLAIGGTLRSDSMCFVPVEGVNTLKLIVGDACGAADTCITTVGITLNRAPVVTTPADTAITVCNLNQICLPGFSVTDLDNNIVSTNITGGTLNGNSVCLTPVAGINTITIIAVDACGKADTGITHVNVSLNSFPVATCPGSRTMVVSNLNSICISGFSCADPDNNIASIQAVGGVLHGDSICFTPVLGINNIGIIGTDACGLADTCMTQVTVVQALSLSLIGGNAPEFTEELADSFVVQISGGDQGSLAYAISFIGHAGAPSRYTNSYAYPNIKNVMTFDYLGEFSSANSPFGYKIIVHDTYSADTLDLSLIVHDNNRQPNIAPLADTSIIIGQALSFNVTATDPDLDNTLTLTKTLGPGSFSSVPGFSPVNGTFSWTPSPADGGVHAVAFSVADGRGGLATRSMQITVLQNQPPIIHILNLPVDSTYNFTEERPDSIIIIANDPENAPVTFAFTFPNESGYPSRFSSTTNGDSLILHLTFDFLGTWSNIDSPFEANIVAHDPYGSSTAHFSIAVADSNRVPGITSINDTTIFAGSTLAFAVTGSDLDSDNIISLSKTSGPGTFNSLPGYPPVTGNYSWTTSNIDVGSHQVMFHVGDGRGGYANDNVNVTVVPSGINLTLINGNPPVFTEEIADSFMVDLGGFDPASLAIAGTFTGHTGSPARYSATLSGNSIKVRITFDYLGEFSSAHSPFAFRLIAHDNFSSDTLNVSLTVHDNNRAPDINVFPSYAFQIDHLTSFAVVVNDLDTDNLLHLVKVSGPGTFSEANGAPPISSLFSWTPTDADLPNSPYTIVFAATDGAGGHDTANVVITILPDGVPVLQILYQPQNFREGIQDSLVFTANDPDGDPIAGLSYKFLGPDSTFPGASFTYANNIGKIRLTFDYNGIWSSAHSPFGLRLMAWSTTSLAGIDSTHLDVPITVFNTNRQPNLIVAGPHSVFAGNSVGLTLMANDPDTDDNISLTASNLPSGSSFIDNGSGNGMFNWNPANSDVGAHEFRFFANDGKGTANSIDTVFWPLQVNPQDTGGSSTNGLVIGCTSAAPGTHVLVPVYLQAPNFYTGGFEVLIGTDPTVLTADSIIWGSRINYGNEYHYWNHHAEGPGTDRFVWLANISDGQYTPPAGPGNDVIFWIRYRVAAGEYLFGTHVPIQFIINDYTDNTISDSTGYIFVRPPFLTLTEGCVDVVSPAEYLGDPNMNCQLYEIADVVLVARRLVNSYSVWSEDDAMGDTPPGCGRHYSGNDPLQEAASDLNHNNYVDVADLVRFINIINGYADPPPGKIDPASLKASISISENFGNNIEIKLMSNTDIAGAMITINHPGIELGTPTAPDGMDIMSSDSDGVLKVLIYSLELNSIHSGNSTLFTISKSGDGELSFGELSASDLNGQLIPITQRLEAQLPLSTSLESNFPNPFNPSTKIKFSLADGGNTSLIIYDIAGRKVCDLAGGYMEAGYHELVWNGRTSSNDEVASGVYFARLIHDRYDKIIKMSLIK